MTVKVRKKVKENMLGKQVIFVETRTTVGEVVDVDMGDHSLKVRTGPGFLDYEWAFPEHSSEKTMSTKLIVLD